MERSTNALAELAERLEGIADVFRHEETTRYSDVIKAQRIVAGLAKVKLNGVGWPVRIELADAYEQCRAIAEEGV